MSANRAGNVRMQVAPAGPLRGELLVPGDKSISHRAVMLGAIATGRSRISGFLAGEDTLATMRAFQQMGVRIDRREDTALEIHGVGRDGLRAAHGPLDLGNSGTSARLLSGLLAGQAFDSEIIGDASLMQRPMGRVVDPLRLMGAELSCTAAGTLPLKIRGGARLHGVEFALPVASAQVKSALLLAGLYAEGDTCVMEPAPTRDHTERMLRMFGVEVRSGDGRICVNRQPLCATDIQVPADISSAAFFLVAASIVPGSDLVLKGVGINPTRAAVIDILRAMGAQIEIHSSGAPASEPVADLRVRYSPLTGIHIPRDLVPIAIDEFPAILVAAACADGITVLTGAAELRVKESDRIAAMAAGLHALGITAEPAADGMSVTGGVFRRGTVDSAGDHRIAMAFAVAGCRASGQVQITDCANVNTSFPGFAGCLRAVGGNISEQQV
ncbi:MAG: 3-phosphoshikimate 1-carboxyvinyltransferase [Gammaproteobacteria bacterium RIFCSPLOWO2_02_FULL_61_13]|nr:MAG: 3-phosphoshikimate 1-carboxyvinyltransferase [Gammaproteobacteria bacterium RIFCSPLOWO2_02_FULL_61_13]